MSIRTATTKSVAYAPQVQSIPLLPGNNFHDDPVNRSSLRKSHTLGQSSAEDAFVCPTEYSQTNNPYGAAANASQGATARPTSDEIQQKWAQYDTPFRFVAYFKEAVTESRDETFRLRTVCITYFPSDTTLLIRESRVPNSGLPTTVHGGGGVICRRQRVYDTEGATLKLEDFQVGGEVEVYGRVYKIIDTDEATRNELLKRGFEVGERIPFPSEDDRHAQLNDLRMKKTGVRSLRTEDMDVKRIAEFALSGRYSKAHPEQTKAVRQFLTADGSRNLTFSLLWDEQRRAGQRGEIHILSLKYYLEDDSVEISEHRQLNSGREGGAKFLCRQRLVKNSAEPVQGQHNTYGRLLKNNYLTYHDFKIGSSYEIHGKQFLMFDADEYTRSWFIKEGKGELPPALDVSDIVNRDHKDPVKHYPPAHNGYGKEQDSLGNWRNLILRPMHKDEKKLLKEGHIVFKFKARFHKPVNEEDADREFVLNYYEASGEFQISEVHVKNSGIVCGRYLGKTQLFRTNADTGKREQLCKDDLYEGAVIPVLAKNFVLYHMDERSQKYRDHIPDPPSVEHVKHLVLSLREIVHQKYDRVGVAMKAITLSPSISVKDFISFFEKHNQHVSYDEARTLVMHYDTHGAGTLNHADFIQLIEGQLAPALSHVEATPEDDRCAIEDKANAERSLYIATLGALRDKLLQRRTRHQEVFRLMVCPMTSLLS